MKTSTISSPADGHRLALRHIHGGGLTPLLDSEGKPIITKGGYKR